MHRPRRVRRQARQGHPHPGRQADFDCKPRSRSTIKRDDVYGKYRVAGCGQDGVYSAQCLMGNCSAERLRGEK
jgi:hypothetical protein